MNSPKVGSVANGKEPWESLQDLLRVIAPGTRWDILRDWEDFHRKDFGVLWSELVASPKLSPAAVAELTLPDIAAIARIWGQHLIPVPYILRLGIARWCPKVPQGMGAATLAFPRGDRNGIAPWLAESSWRIITDVSTGESVEVEASSSYVLGNFDPALPITRVSVESAMSADVRREAAILGLAEAVGSAEGAFDIAMHWAADRQVFGRPLNQLQIIKHMFADMHIDIVRLHDSLALALVYPGGVRLIIQDALTRARSVIANSIQLLGARGFCWDAGVALYLRHVLTIDALLGGFLLPSEAE